MNLAGLLALCAALFVAQRNSSTSAESKPEEKDEKSKAAAAAATSQAREAAKASQRAFLIVYALVMGADWLQVKVQHSTAHDTHPFLTHYIHKKGPLPLLALHRRAQGGALDRLDALHDGLRVRRRQRHLRRLPRRQPGPQGRLHALLPALLGLVPADHPPGGKPTPAFPGPRARRHQHEHPLQRLRDVDGRRRQLARRWGRGGPLARVRPHEHDQQRRGHRERRAERVARRRGGHAQGAVRGERRAAAYGAVGDYGQFCECLFFSSLFCFCLSYVLQLVSCV